MRPSLIAFVCVATACSISAAPLPFPAFKVQEIDKTLKVGYGLRVVDLNADGKPDVVVADANRVIWFDNAGGWKPHTIIDNAKVGVKPDNVCLAIHDIDGDGKLDVALGADWQINNTSAGGSLQWLRQGKTIDDWTVHKIADLIPTLHRIHFGDVDKDGKPELIVGPIRGVGSTARENYMDKPLRLVAYTIPKDPAGKWDEPRVLDDSMHHLHNFTLLDINGDKTPEILTASAEGVGALMAGEGGKWTWTHVGAGFQDDPKGARGSSEVKFGMMKEQSAFLVAIEPLHGHQVVTYRFRSVHVETDEKGNPVGPPPKPEDLLAIRTVVDDQMNGGHALWCVDLDGDGLDEIIAGFREPGGKGGGPGINVYKAAGPESPMVWSKYPLDDKGMACEDLACADLNGDGRIDVVAAGRSTGNVRIYWNLGTPAAK
jgi:hypothetical protein